MERILVNVPTLDGNESKYLQEAISTGWISSEGPFVKKLEKGLAEQTGRKHAVAICNGTAALQVAVEALNLPQGSEVIMPSFTIISCAAAVVRAGLKPVFVDSDPITWNMDLAQVESSINPKTSAIMAVHMYGLPVDMDKVLLLARKHSLKVIEDAAEMIGQTYRGKQCGSFGDVSIFSFYPNKHITTGEGGMVLTDDDSVASRSRALINLCFIPERRFLHRELGYNFRMSNLQAAVGVAQMERLDSSVERKRLIGSKYRELLKDIPGLQQPLHQTEYADNIYWVYGLVLNDSVAYDATEVSKRLSQKGIETRPFFYPMHEQPVFNEMGLGVGQSLPVAERIARRGFYIPSGLGLTDQQMGYIARELRATMVELVEESSKTLQRKVS